MNNELTRRSLLAIFTAGLLPDAALAEGELCPNDPAISNASAPLTIDTHAHFFNGSDLQIREFLSQTTVGPESELYPMVKALAGMLQGLGWHLAPRAQAERAAIARYASRLQECSGADQMRRLASGSFQEGYAIGRRELQRVAGEMSQSPATADVLAPKPGLAGLGAAIAGLPESYEEFEERQADTAGVLGSQPTFLGYIQFVLHQFNLRHVNALDYLNTYSRGSARKVDLVAASMVDYDYWLARGEATPTSLSDQVDVMSRISVLLGGRVHGFAPFCPFRETVTSDGTGAGASMQLVKRAIESGGFIGVKLYPPMGFAPWGNAGKTVWQGKATLLPVASTPDFGSRLDTAMARLFEYCLMNDVPIMAHTNHSNGPYEQFRALAGSEYWKLALEKFPGLRVSFGHFGDSDPEDHAGDRTRPFLNLMTPGSGTAGRNTFADSGYFAGTLMNQIKMRDVMLRLYDERNRILLERLMYGTDWTMILTQKNVERYLSDFMDVMRRVEQARPGISVRQTSLTNAFFGRNAVEWLGLKRGRGNRARLEAFYATHRVAPPDWMKKVDAA